MSPKAVSKRSSQQAHAKERSRTARKTRQNKAEQSSYFKQADSDVLDEDSDVGTKKRKFSTRRSKNSSSPTKKRKIHAADEEYDEAADASTAESAKVYDSDALDDDSDVPAVKTKRKSRAATKASPKKASSPRKKKQVENDDEYDDIEEGQEVVGMVVQAPKTGRVPPGQISQNTFDFLKKLIDPECNDRKWFKLHEPVYRLAEKEWKDFVEAITDVIVEVDPQVPPLPPKDVIHRIYRDVRFSNDKTPYKTNFSASFSRSGRKGIFAGYHVAVKPGNESLIAAGSWCPGRNELANIRTNVQRNSRRLRSVISAPEFVRFFGEPRPHPKGKSQNIFGMEDELKVAPKGVPKDHKDIDLLKCRSFVVMHKFLDSEVLSPDFKETVASVARVLQPLVHCLNDMMTVTAANGDEDDEDGEDSDDAQNSD